MVIGAILIGYAACILQQGFGSKMVGDSDPWSSFLHYSCVNIFQASISWSVVDFCIAQIPQECCHVCVGSSKRNASFEDLTRVWRYFRVSEQHRLIFIFLADQ